MARSRQAQRVLEFLYDTPPEGRQVIPGVCGLTTEEYGILKASIYRKEKPYWRAGRAGFTFSTDVGFTRLPGYEEEFSGIWVFPAIDLAIAKREELLSQGWGCRLTSWD